MTAVRRRVKVPEDVTSAPSQKTVKVAQTLYRKTGNLLLQFRFQISNQLDAEIWVLFFPALLALVLEPVQALIDTAILGHLGVPELGAVGFGTVVFQFALGFFAALIFATTPIVASYAANNDLPGASKSAAQGMWVAFVLGVALQIFVWFSAPEMLSMLSSNEQVADLAVDYLRARAWGIPAALVMMVAIGTARGHREMTSPFIGSLVYGIVLGVLDLVFVFGMSAGVEGAGAAAAISQWLSAAAIIKVLITRGELNIRDLLQSPTDVVRAAVPYVRMAPNLALNSLAALAPILVSTSLATGLGADGLAAHTVIRQLSAFWLQVFVAFNATAHSVVASALGSSQKSAGMEKAALLLERICQLAVVLSAPMALALYASRDQLPGIFTADPIVTADVSAVLPLLLISMPLDALGTSLEGGILGATDTRWIALRTATSSALSIGAMLVAASMQDSLLVIWVCLKLLNWGALGLDLVRFMGPIAKGGGVLTTVSGSSNNRIRRP